MKNCGAAAYGLADPVERLRALGQSDQYLAKLARLRRRQVDHDGQLLTANNHAATHTNRDTANGRPVAVLHPGQKSRYTADHHRVGAIHAVIELSVPIADPCAAGWWCGVYVLPPLSRRRAIHGVPVVSVARYGMKHNACDMNPAAQPRPRTGLTQQWSS